ncbi:P-loop containing nucleoside triphosphate hydrolase protein [Suillus decipiens]|nr:P-loop containing nucleoside triphosphate hydrolase protein [Suillus decipiens]
MLRPLFLGNPNPSFTSSYQAELMQSCLTNEHVLCVMPTGSGKSLAFFAAPLIHPHALFIVITPLVALTEDMAQRLATTRIEGGQYPHIQNVLTAQIVIVSAHQAGMDDFFHWAQSVNQRLVRVFIDEAHHVFTLDDYRNCFKLFHLITALAKPITCLTATMSPISLPRLYLQMQIPPLLVRVIRAPLHRSNISYSVISVPTAQLKEKVLETHRSIVLQEKDRGIIYCTTITLIKELSELLNIPFYMSRLDDQLDDSTNTEEKNRRFNAWHDGDTPSQRWMIATLCFGEGIDFPGVCYVIHGEVNNMLCFLQETGHLGQDGHPSSSVLIYSKLLFYQEPECDEHLGVLSMREFMKTQGCCHLTFHHFDPHAHLCASATGTLLCDNCKHLKKVSNLPSC